MTYGQWISTTNPWSGTAQHKIVTLSSCLDVVMVAFLMAFVLLLSNNEVQSWWWCIHCLEYTCSFLYCYHPLFNSLSKLDLVNDYHTIQSCWCYQLNFLSVITRSIIDCKKKQKTALLRIGHIILILLISATILFSCSLIWNWTVLILDDRYRKRHDKILIQVSRNQYFQIFYLQFLIK